MRVVEAHAGCPEQFLFKEAIVPVRTLLNAVSLPQLLNDPWLRFGDAQHSYIRREEVSTVDIDNPHCTGQRPDCQKPRRDRRRASTILGITPKVRKTQRCSISTKRPTQPVPAPQPQQAGNDGAGLRPAPNYPSNFALPSATPLEETCPRLQAAYDEQPYDAIAAGMFSERKLVPKKYLETKFFNGSCSSAG